MAKKIKIQVVIDKLNAKSEKVLAKLYAKSLREIRVDLTQIFDKYSKAGKLTFAEMAKYGRLKALDKEISGQLKGLSRQVLKEIDGLESEVYQEAYYRTAFAIELEAGAKLNYTILNPKVIEAAVQNPLSGLTLSERLRKNRADVIVKTKEQITQGLIKGEAYEKVSKRVKDVLEGDLVKARRIVRTESHRNQSLGKLNSMGHASDFGVELEKVWVTRKDGDRVRLTHRSMEGQTVPLDKDFVLVSGKNRGATAPAPGLFGIASEDINGRCTFREQIVGFEPGVQGKNAGQIPTDFSTWSQDKNIRI